MNRYDFEWDGVGCRIIDRRVKDFHAHTKSRLDAEKIVRALNAADEAHGEEVRPAGP